MGSNGLINTVRAEESSIYEGERVVVVNPPTNIRFAVGKHYTAAVMVSQHPPPTIEVSITVQREGPLCTHVVIECDESTVYTIHCIQYTAQRV